MERCETLHAGNEKGSERIARRAYEILDMHAHFRGRAAHFDFTCREDVLIVRGAVPTFYLKQVLQSVLKDIEGIRMIENQVQVMPAVGNDDGESSSR
jgi:hypothetical protein